MASQWYETAWRELNDDTPWAQNTVGDVDFVCGMLDTGKRLRILDLACGNGRHSLELSARGHDVVGVDLEPGLIEVAEGRARERGLAARFRCADVRELDFRNEFDVVLNLWEGAIGYFETDSENFRLFRVIARALAPAGHHIAGPLYNADYIARCAPLQIWTMGSRQALLSRVQWDGEQHTIIDTCTRFSARDSANWQMFTQNPVRYRVYTPAALSHALSSLGLRTCGFYREPSRQSGADEWTMEYWIHSIKDR
jgi:SAM-dependent methyltransferase